MDDRSSPLADRLVPVLRPLSAFRPTAAPKDSAHRGSFLPHIEAFVAGLVVAYAEGSWRDARLLFREELDALGLSGDALRRRAVRNLRRALPKPQRIGGPEAYTLAVGGCHEPDLLLDDALWQAKHLPVEGDIVVAVPSCDLLLVTGTGHPAGVARIRQLAREVYARGKDAVLQDLLVRRRGAWEVLPAWTPYGAAGS